MRIVLGVVALLVAAAAVPGPARGQEMGASVSAPFRQDIDAKCDPLEHAPAKSWVHFQRIVAKPGVTPRWTRQISASPKAGAAQSQDETLPAGTFAHVLKKNGHIVFASLWQTAGNGDDGGTTSYCYAGDHLIRMRAQKVVPTTTGTLTRTKYYDGGKLLTHTEQKTNFSDEDMKKPITLPDRDPVYLRPAALPFYAVMTKAR